MLVGTNLSLQPANLKQMQSPAEEMALFLVKVSEQRCKSSYAKLFTYFAPRLRAYAFKQVGSEALAMELVQDTLATVWQKAHLFDSQKGSPSTWIFTICRNNLYDMLRKQQSSKEDICADDLWPVLCEQTADVQQVPLDEQVSWQQLNQLFTQLPDKQRSVVEAIYLQGKSQLEVADMLGIPLGTVKSRTRLALQRLKEMLHSHD